MFRKVSFTVVIAALLGLTASSPVAAKYDCVVCTLLMGLASQQMQLQGTDGKTAMNKLCSYLPLGTTISDICADLVDTEFAQAIDLLNKKESPDAICQTIAMCTNPQCHLFPLKHGSIVQYERHLKGLKAEAAKKNLKESKFDICTLVPGVCAMEAHRPFFDSDQDFFSTAPTLRGYDWRGRDCNDLDASVFPGRSSSDATVDANCNGIYGVNPASGKTYEDEWCSGTQSMGVASLGDSATAHFRLPPEWVTASQLDAAVLKPVLKVIEDEADWPMLSWSTGWANASDYAPLISGPTNSLYSMMRADNFCNHRDYQNIGVNGASSGNLYDFAGDLDRNTSKGYSIKPLMLIMSMVGNDVCGHYHDFDHMTKPAAYKANVLKALTRADAMLPAGSIVVLVPLVDGRILFDSMHNRIHPIGLTNNDVTYSDLYEYLNCLDTSPCWGWMNTNATVRNMTWKIAQALNEQLPAIIQSTQGKWKNIKLVSVGNLFDEALAAYAGPKWELIEPVDGFHPSQLANSIIGKTLYNSLKAIGALPPVNPNNAKILAKFGNQGGYTEN